MAMANNKYTFKKQSRNAICPKIIKREKISHGKQPNNSTKNRPANKKQRNLDVQSRELASTPLSILRGKPIPPAPEDWTEERMKFTHISKLTKESPYQVHVSWDYIEQWIQHKTEKQGLDINPDFQRCHVWDKERQRKFVEFMLRGGKSSEMLRFNCVGWMDTYKGPFVLVDGKQRLEAVRRFLRNDLKVFPEYGNVLLSDFSDKSRAMSEMNFIISINNLQTRKDVLQWYLDINSGGVVHTDEELDLVANLLKLENDK